MFSRTGVTLASFQSFQVPTPAFISQSYHRCIMAFSSTAACAPDHHCLTKARAGTGIGAEAPGAGAVARAGTGTGTVDAV